MDAQTQASLTADASERTLQDDLRLLAADAKALAEAEVAYQKARAGFAGSELPRIAMLGIVAAVLAFFALMALTVGAVLSLTPVLGPWGATAAVVGGLLFIAALCAGVAVLRWKFVAGLLSDKGDRP